MAKTLIGVFDEAASAQSAVRELAAIGIRQNHIRLSSSTEKGERSQSDKDKGGLKHMILGMFEALFENESDRSQAHHYAEAWRRGHYIVTVDVENSQADRAVEILNRFGTVDLSERAEHWKSTGYKGVYDASSNLYTEEERKRELESYQPRTESVVQEELAVGKQVVQRGGVRIHSYVQERPVEEIVRLREERVNVQRRPVDRPADNADAAFNQRTLEVTAQGEEAVVGKRARVVEEVVVGKDVSEREQAVTGTVRRKDVDVEQIDEPTAAEKAGGQRR
jgi:uncharacterized protein (TIGR02271 family)